MSMTFWLVVFALAAVCGWAAAAFAFWRARAGGAQNAQGAQEAAAAIAVAVAEAAAKEHTQTRGELREIGAETRKEISAAFAALRQETAEKQDAFARRVGEQLQSQFNNMNERLQESNAQTRQTVERQLRDIREDNEKQLGAMRKTVDEKLQDTLEKRLGESFKLVGERLEQVHRGLGEMKNIAGNVHDLKGLLANVKTRGTWGEYQLANILEEILTAQQYEKEFAPEPNGAARVEFAVRLPGKADGEPVYLPIDSKFPLTHYENLQAAAQSGGKEQEAEAQKALFAALQKMAGDIAEKYIVPPRTTDFAVMFLPTEGLYAEALREPGFADKLRREKKVLLTGPATLAALLNSLSAGFRTLAVQKRSGEVWKILAEVKQEFGKFGDALERAQNQIYTASNTLDALRNTRSRQLLRKLDKAESLEETATAPAVDKTE